MSIPVQGTSVTGRDRALVQRSRSMCTWCESPPRTQDLNRTGFRGGSQSGRLGVMGAPRRYPDELRERAVRMVFETVSYTHLRAHETVLDLVCRLLLEKKK